MNKEFFKSILWFLFYAVFPVAYLFTCQKASFWMKTGYATTFSYNITAMALHFFLLFLIGLLVFFLYILFTKTSKKKCIGAKIGMIIGILYCLILALPIPVISALMNDSLSRIYISLYTSITLPAIFLFAYLLALFPIRRKS